ncbi:hypothetical protein MRX96_051445 [Rhipicephalus microplus]
MDPDGRREMWELLLKVRRTCSIFLTTQHLDEADVLGDRIVIMANGQIRPFEDLIRKYAPKVKLQSDSDNEGLERRSSELGIASVGLTVTALEDVLLRVGEEAHVHQRKGSERGVSAERRAIVHRCEA